MTGEMYRIDPITGVEPDGTVWSLHAAIAQALGGTVQPFDQYQGPYILVGPDIRIGTRPYQLAVQHMGVKRLWICSDDGDTAFLWREDTDTQSEQFFYTETDWAIDLATMLMKDEVLPC